MQCGMYSTGVSALDKVTKWCWSESKVLLEPTKPTAGPANLPQTQGEKLRLIVGIKLAALQGSLALLSQTESINGSFYDLFNQNFRAITREDFAVLDNCSWRHLSKEPGRPEL